MDEADPERLRPRNRALSDEAIAWIVRLGSHDAKAADQADFIAWQDRSPAHAAAAAEVVHLLDRVGEGDVAQEYRLIGAALRQPVPQSRAMGRRALLGGGLVAALGVGAMGSGLFGPPARLIADYGTGVGERRHVRLADGSSVWLNTASALSVDFSGRERRLTLHAGEALFDSVADRHRPFVVGVGDGEARASGGLCSVRCRGAVADVAVGRGVAEVRSGMDSARLAAGEGVSFGEGIISAVRVADFRTAAAWVRGKLIFNDRPVAQVMAEMERYHHGRIVVLGDRLRRLNISGVFALDDPDSLFRSVAGMAGAEIIRMPLLTILR